MRRRRIGWLIGTTSTRTRTRTTIGSTIFNFPVFIFVQLPILKKKEIITNEFTNDCRIIFPSSRKKERERAINKY
jgi:hypothetical protein